MKKIKENDDREKAIEFEKGLFLLESLEEKQAIYGDWWE